MKTKNLRKLFEYDYVKDKLFVKVYPKKGNGYLLINAPHREIEDLILFPYVLLDKSSTGEIVSGPDVQFENNKDFICTLNYIFNIEDDKLHLTVGRRSQDLLFGIPYDYVFEFLLMEKMLKELSNYYPDLKLGSYTMFANNVHIYERNFEIFKCFDSNLIAKP